MTADEYFDAHIPHRLNLLIAYRTRYSGNRAPCSIDPEFYRDLFRCAKDMSLLMARFFCGELGIYFDEREVAMKDSQNWKSRFGSTRVILSAIRSDPRCSALCDMYRAANHAVAHINPQGIDHSFKMSTDDQRMIAVITWIESLIREHIYRDAGRDLATSMSRPDNKMT